MAASKTLKPRRLPKQQRAEETIAHILEGAAQVLAERGFEKTSTNHIARRAGVSVGTLYQYFPNKEALIAALFDRLSEKVVRLLEERLHAFNRDDPVEETREFFRELVAIYKSSPDLVDTVLEHLSAIERREKYGATQQRLLSALLAYAQRLGGIDQRALPLKLYVAFAAGELLLWRFFREPDPHYSEQQLTEEVNTLLVNYLFSVADKQG